MANFVAKTFRIGSYGDDFSTGTCNNGNQLIIGLLCPNIILYRFDAIGRRIGREIHPWNFPAPLDNGIYQIFDPTFQARIRDQISRWKTELGFKEEKVDVQLFYDVEQDVGIEVDEARGCAFVFWWAKDYWMNENGEVEST
jgi:hypothetical protein